MSTVVEEFVVLLGRGGEFVEGGVDVRVLVPGPALDRGEVTVERGLDRLGGGAYLGNSGQSGIRHRGDAIRSRALPAQ
jgi:hypothetical protein